MRQKIEYKKGDVIGTCKFIKEVSPIVFEVTKTNKSKTIKRCATFQCDCGKEFDCMILAVKNGNTKSCGCLRDNKIQQQGFKNKKHGLHSNPLYQVWKSMISRCEKPNDMNYFRYGARGIKVSDEWKDIHTFVKDMEPSYKKGLQLDRQNNNGNYCKDNCRWVTSKVNNNNTRRNRFIEYNGTIKTVGEWADFTGIDYATLISRLNNWDVERVFTTPYSKRNPNKNIKYN
jgi:hypothetical protein